MRIKNIRRGDNTTTAEMKYVLLFETELVINDVKIQVWRKSVPIVIIENDCEEFQAWATVTWSNAFRDVDIMPQQTTWSRIVTMLNAIFIQQTGTNFSNANILYLCMYSVQ